MMEAKMIKTQEKATTITKRNSTETEIALIKKDIETIKDNHLAHLEKDVNLIHKKVDKIDNRLWWLAGIIIVATLGPLIGSMFM